jgi:SAM-dependent methyltransferase
MSIDESVLTDLDAFGLALLSRFEGYPAMEIIERDDNRISASPLDEYFAEFGEWHPVEQEAMDIVVGDVLDIGCGAGRHALHLQGLGVRVTGIDSSPAAIEVAVRRGVQDVRLASIDDVPVDSGPFGTVLLLGNNFGLLGGWSQGRTILTRLRDAVTPQARLITQVVNPYVTTDPGELRYQEQNRREGRMAGQNRLRVRHGRAMTPWFEYLHASPDEVVAIVADTGWRVGDTLQMNERRSIVVLETVG